MLTWSIKHGNCKIACLPLSDLIIYYFMSSSQSGFFSLLNSVVCSLQDKDITLSGEHVREGLTCVVSVKVPNPEFEGQTKVLPIFYISLMQCLHSLLQVYWNIGIFRILYSFLALHGTASSFFLTILFDVRRQG